MYPIPLNTVITTVKENIHSFEQNNENAAWEDTVVATAISFPLPPTDSCEWLRVRVY